MTASSSWSDKFTPANLGSKDDTPWHGKGDGKNQWLEFAFDQPTNIDGFRTKAPKGWELSSFKVTLNSKT